MTHGLERFGDRQADQTVSKSTVNKKHKLVSRLDSGLLGFVRIFFFCRLLICFSFFQTIGSSLVDLCIFCIE